MLKQISEKNKVTAGDMELEPVDALVRFFVKLLSCLKEYFPSETIRKLVISVSDKTDNLVNALKGALNRIGIGRGTLCDSAAPAELYVLCTQPEERAVAQ